MKNTTVQVGTIHVNFTPFAMAKMSNGFFQASVNYEAKDIPLLNFFLYCASIELGLKASILSKSNSKSDELHLKNKVGHDIEKAYSKFQSCFPKIKLFGKNDIEAIQKINSFYKQKGLEYITLPVIMALMRGMKDFPELADIKSAGNKVNSFIAKHKYFING